VHEVVLSERHLDCRTFFLRKAAGLARARGIDWLATGEVVGQRALDQSHAALVRAERDAGVSGRVLRPLSAGLLPDLALPLDRSVRLHGRTRRGQLDLAARLGLVDAPPPRVGCCRLADPRFAARLRDLIAHRDPAATSRDDIERLARGRHVRVGWNVKVVVGRNEDECRWLEQHSGRDAIARVADRRGALAIVEGTPDDAGLAAAASIVARYCAAWRTGPVEVEVRRPGLAERRLAVQPADDAWIEARRI
jgi:hypothetical protein